MIPSIPLEMRALVLDGTGFAHLQVRRVPVPRPGPGQMLARVDAAGICTSLIKLVEQGPAHAQVYGWDHERFPLILGDEGCVTLVEVGPELSPPVLRRSQMLRVMKTASSILEQTKQIGVRRMAENLIEQLTEIMPELKGVGGWPSVGQRRSLSELGQAAQRFFPSSRYPNLEEY